MSVARLKALFVEYGNIALWTYFGLFLIVLSGFALAIRAGFQVDSAQGGVGVLGAAYVATKVTQPIRIGLALLLTPFVARVVRRRRATQSKEQEQQKPEGDVEPSVPSSERLTHRGKQS